MEEKTVKVICTGLGYGNYGCYSENDIDVTKVRNRRIPFRYSHKKYKSINRGI